VRQKATLVWTPQNLLTVVLSGAQIGAWNPTEVQQAAQLDVLAQCDSTIAKVPEE
jgi:hypothetical protein